MVRIALLEDETQLMRMWAEAIGHDRRVFNVGRTFIETLPRDSGESQVS